MQRTSGRHPELHSHRSAENAKQATPLILCGVDEFLILRLEPLQLAIGQCQLGCRANLLLLLFVLPLFGPLLELYRHLRLVEDGPHRRAVIVGDPAHAGVALVLVVLLEKALQLAQRRAARGLVLAFLFQLLVNGAELRNRAFLPRTM